MAALSDQTDRLSRNTKSIRSIAAKIGNHRGDGVAGPFTRAVLDTALGDLIRDVDPSEIGLFSLTDSTSAGTTRAHERDAKGVENPELVRVEFPGSTPLRKRRDDPKPKEVEPEVYAQAALKYLDRYEPIRPMPRAHSQVTSIVEQVSAVRDSMRTLTQTLEQTTSAHAHLSPKDQINEETRRIKDLQLKISELKKRKEAAHKEKRSSNSKSPRTKHVPSRQVPKAKPSASTPKNDDHEETFWATPAEAARTLRFDNLLKDDLVDLGDMSMSFSSPIPPPRSIPSLSSDKDELVPTHEQHSHEPDGVPPERSLDLLDNYDDEVEDGVGGEDERTVVLKKPPHSEPEPSSPSPSASPPEPLTPVHRSGSMDTPSRSKRLKVRINSEVERIVLKIWATVGEIIMPGNPFTSSGNKPPRAKETISHLQSVSAHTPIPTSPSVTSESSLSAPAKEPTVQQILTAYLILVLLSSSPHFSMPLNKIKEELVSKAGGSAAALNVGTTRILYGCVAKRLVKIERGGGEQIVKFDV